MRIIDHIPYFWLWENIFNYNGRIIHLTTNINDYENVLNAVKNASKMMPKLESLSDYEEIRFSSQEKLFSFTLGFCSYGISLFVKYENNYDYRV